MQLTTSKAAGYVTPLLVSFITITVFTLWVSEARAYEKYSGCKDCHGSFRGGQYTSLSDGSRWSDNLHNVHRNDMLGGDCDACHASGGKGTVFIDRSQGGEGLTAISCVGCHGREEDIGNDSVSAGRGAGLRQHHTNAGQTDCQDCHSDAVPAKYTPAGEDVLPNYFANPGTNHPSMPTDSCNPAGNENFSGTTLGLDNDGDGSYDTADPDCITTFKINAGLNDAWYYKPTDGQGFFITVFPDLGYVSLAWFTYDTELPAEDAVANLGDPGHRWLTAIGPIDGNQITMNITITSGGIFDDPAEIDRTDPPGSDGTIMLTFESCSSGTIEYDIPSINRQGVIPIERVADDNIVICEALNSE